MINKRKILLFPRNECLSFVFLPKKVLTIEERQRTLPLHFHALLTRREAISESNNELFLCIPHSPQYSSMIVYFRKNKTRYKKLTHIDNTYLIVVSPTTKRTAIMITKKTNTKNILLRLLGFTGSSARTIVLILVVSVVLSMRICDGVTEMSEIHWLHCHSLSGFAVDFHLLSVLGRLVIEQLGDRLNLLSSQRFGEFNHKSDEQCSVLELVASQRHTLIGNTADLIGLDDLTRIGADNQLTTVQMSDGLGETTKSFRQRNLHLHRKIGTLASEDVVLLDGDVEHDITSLAAGSLIGHAIDYNRISILHALLHEGLHRLGLADDLVAVAFLAAKRRIDSLALTATFAARTLRLADHVAHSLDVDGVATALAGVAADLATISATLALTLGTDDLVSNAILGGLAVVGILEGNGDLSVVVGGATRTSGLSGTAAEEGAEQIGGIRTGTGAVLESLLAVLVVDLSLLGIGEGLVSKSDLLELH